MASQEELRLKGIRARGDADPTSEFLAGPNAIHAEVPSVGLLDPTPVDSVPLLEPPRLPPVGIEDARETAILETTITGDTSDFDKRVTDNLVERGVFDIPSDNIRDQLIRDLQRMVQEGTFSEDISLITDPSGFATNQDLTDQLIELLALADKRYFSDKMMVNLHVLLQGGADITIDQAEEFGTSIGFEQIQALRNDIHNQDWIALQASVDKIVMGEEWDNVVTAVLDMAGTEVIPVANVAGKMYFLGKIGDFLGIPDERRSFVSLGDSTQALKEWILEIGPLEASKSMDRMHEWMKEARKDPLMNAFMRQYMVLEQFERVYDGGLLSARTAENNFDLWFGRFETALEIFLVAWLVKRPLKVGLKMAFGAADRFRMTKLSRQSANRSYQTESERLVQGKIAEDLGISQGEAALSTMPRPNTFVDERTIHLPGVEDTVKVTQILEGEIIKAHVGRLGRLLNEGEKQSILNAEIEKIQLGDHARVVPAMSTMEALEDGIQIRAVITKNGESPYNGFDELLIDLLDIDPTFEHLTILRRGVNGTLERVDMTPDDLARIATLRPEGLSDAALLSRSKATTNIVEFDMLEREFARRAGGKVDGILKDEFFLEYEHFRAFHPVDKVAFGADTFRHSIMPDIVLSPNAQFGDEIAGSFIAGAAQEARIVRLFNDLQQPFYKLNQASKRRVAAVFEWAEDWATETGRTPDLFETIAQFPDLTPKEISGLVAVRKGLDLQEVLLNRRLYLEFSGLGYKTASPIDPNMARYHGAVLEREAVQGVTFYDPVTQEMVRFNKRGVDELYRDGGSIMKLDVPIDVPGTNGMVKSTRILVDGDKYRIGKLHQQPLEHYPGYQYRFPRDPYYITKRTEGIEVDGVRKAATETSEEAIKTVGTAKQAEAFLSRAFTKAVNDKGATVWVDDDGSVYTYVRARDITQQDNMLMEKDALRRQNRLFWDRRSRERLLDVNGNRSEVLDFTRALERGTSLSIRLNTQEDMMRTLKHAFHAQYSNLGKKTNMVTDDVGVVINDLREELIKATDAGAKARLKEALNLAKYIRQLEGVDDLVVPWMRDQVLRLAVWADRVSGQSRFKQGAFKNIERWAQDMDPMRAMRKIPYALFMVFKPMRQLVLQASQPLFLAGIDPAYVLSGRGLTDAIALRMGFGKLRYANYLEDGYSGKILAKFMNLTPKEYRHLVKKLDESGTIDVVDVHSFSGGTRRWQQLAPSDGTVTGQALYGARKTGSFIYNKLKAIGFDTGEAINKLATFNIAWRRVKRNKGYKSLLELTDDDWKRVYLDTENLSFSMTRPGAFSYQQGFWSVTTQFLSFTHKMALSLMGQNPALSTKETLRIWVGLFTLYGANVVGLRDNVSEFLEGIGLGDSIDAEIPGQLGGTVLDLLSAGAIQTFFNKVGQMTVEDWKNLDTENVGPIFNAKQFYEMQFESVLNDTGAALFGAFGNRFSKVLDSLQFTHNTLVGKPDEPLDRFVFILDNFFKNTVPQYSDVTKAWLWLETGKLYTTSGNPMHIRPTINAVLAKGVFGVITEEEAAAWRLRDLTGESNNIVEDMIRSGRTYMKQYFFLYNKGEVTRETMNNASQLAGELAKLAPDGRHMEVAQGIMLPYFSDDNPEDMLGTQLAQSVVEDANLTPGQIKSLMRDIEMDDTQRAMLEMWIEDAMNERVLNDKEMNDILTKDTPGLR